MERVRIATAAAAALVMASPAVAAAGGFSIGARPVWFVTGGSTAGYTVAADEGGGFVGGEVSVVRLIERHFVGLYADGFHDLAADATYLTAGPELGWIRRSRTLPVALGFDGGGALRLGDDADLGVTGRVFVAMFGSVAVYGRYAYLDDEDGADHVVQLGVTLKFPLASPFGAGTR